MARRFGKKTGLCVDLTQYSYCLVGVGGIGKSTLLHEFGKKVTGSDEGLLALVFGIEPSPTNIQNPFWEKIEDWEKLEEVVEDLVENREDYAETKFIGVDSLDEWQRLAYKKSLDDYNAMARKAGKEKALTIDSSWGGFQKGQAYALTLVLEVIEKLERANYKFFFIGHSTMKQKKDILQDEVCFDQYTCSLTNKEFEAIKNKVNISCVGYMKNNFANIEEVRDVFSKSKKKVGDLISRERVIVFWDTDNAIDTKSHFKHIKSEIPFNTDAFIDAIKEAIELELKDVQAKAEITADLPTAEQQADQAPAPSHKKEAEQPAVDKASLLKRLQEKCQDKAVLKVAMTVMKEKGYENFKAMSETDLQELVASL